MIGLVEHLSGGELSSARNFCNFIISEANYNIFRLEISMNNLAHAMHVIKADQTLPCKFTCQRHRNSLVVVALDNLQEVDSQDFKYHNEVLSIWAMMHKRIQKLSAVRLIATVTLPFQTCLEFWIILVVLLHGFSPLVAVPILGHLIKNFNFIVSSF